MPRTRPPFDTRREVVLTNKKGYPTGKKEFGGAPKKLTKGLRRQLVKYHRENIDEFHRQCAMLGVTPTEVLAKRSSKK